MLYSLLNGSTDLSKYVQSIGSVPIITRNIDFSVVAEGYSFELSSECATIPELDDIIYFYRNTILLNKSYVSKVKFIEETSIYRIEVLHIFQKLKEYKTDDTFRTEMNLHDVLVSVNLEDHNAIRHLGIIESIFAMIGFTVDYDFFTEKTNWIANGVTGNRDATTIEEVVSSFGDEDIFYLVNQINCLNQEKVWSPSYLNTPEGTQNRVNLFDLLGMLASMTGYNFAIKTTDEVYVIANPTHTTYTLDDDDVFAYEPDEIEKKSLGLTVRYITLKLDSVSIINARWFPTSANQSYYYDESSPWNGNPLHCVEYVYDYNANTNDLSNLNWYNHLNPFVLRWNGEDGTHDVWITVPKYSGSTFPVYFQGRSILLDQTKKIAEVPASIILADLRPCIISLKVIDIHNDVLEMEFV